MSAVLEQYFQHVVVDKINDLISDRFKEIKVELDSKFYEFRLDLESLRKNVSESGQEICGKMREEIKEILAENGKKNVVTQKSSIKKATVSQKSPIKKTTVRQKTPTKKTAVSQKPATQKKRVVKKAPAKKVVKK
ncbi:MAG: hypothetical protein D8M57_04580 [Candidatus Scalindua sp. AMX11]|nr:MAG: hypothetical protein DWQ00_04015 [Candidatus Scalindua sp.]NOG84610.1 hypothetical protein [Planctomycetota bacterium]RZV92384.1 MAG: hypothetical protein EX341_04870 [Candidatus Scalindua sp. SCAELEC01]TDE66091.1 MAG: hypothetical protein D8M57_04580 [Candidatus Scalindua sp. AMX11]GJQ59065.1 MAG: hypothetical protein SCALA701_18660 [Candidatus Scalindua sp.]